MGIFDPIDLPAWMNPTRNVMETGRAATPLIAQNFSAAFQQAKKQKFEKEQQDSDQQFQLDKQDRGQQFKVDQQQQLAEKFNGVAEAFKAGDQTPAGQIGVASQNPQWFADKEVASGVMNYIKTQTDVAKAQVGSIAGQIAVADTSDFAKRLRTIDPKSRALIGETPSNGSMPSSKQWDILTAAETAMKQDAALARTQAEKDALDAVNSGQNVTTTITDKSTGISKRIAPTSASGKEFTPEDPIQYKNGDQLIHVSPQRWQYVRSDGRKVEKSSSELRLIAKDALDKDPNDPVALQIMDKLKGEAANQLKIGLTNSTSSGLKYNIVPLP